MNFEFKCKIDYVLCIQENSVELGYNDQDCNKFKFIMNKILLNILSQILSYNINFHGYRESR